MDNDTLKKANELKRKISTVDDFVYTYNNTWRYGFLKKETKVFVGHKGYGIYPTDQMECDKELSDAIYNTLLEYQSKIHKEFDELGSKGV